MKSPGPNSGSLEEPTAPDGSPVGLYAVLPPGEESATVDRLLARHASILDLGCGTGRLARAFTELGHTVVGVDQSADMLAYATDVETVLADIEGLDLNRKFDCVLLSSYLVNTIDVNRRRAFLETCRRHVGDRGIVVLQCMSLHRATTLQAGYSNCLLGVALAVSEAKLDDHVWRATLEYTSGATSWQQVVQVYLFEDDEFRSVILESGLYFVRWLDIFHEWAIARRC